MNNYYEKNAKQYIEETINCDMKDQYDLFLQYMPKTGKILDIGFGSGRDMIYFASKGYEVEGIDPTPSFIDNMKEKGFNVRQLMVEELQYENEFNGIWACASLLHVKRENLLKVLKKCRNALKDNGVMYCSFKYGNCEIVKDERYFNYLDEQTLKEILDTISFKIVDIKISNDVRVKHASEKWINIILKKI